MTERLVPTGIHTIIVGNNREYFSPLDSNVQDELRDEFVQSDIDEADMDIMWHGDNKIVLLPRNIDPDFISDVPQLFGYKNIHVFVPHDRGVGLSKNILQDPQTYRVVEDSIRTSHEINLIPWGHTPQYQELADRLRNSGLIFSTPETPGEDSLWVPEYLDTKIGSREVLLRAKEKTPDIKVPEEYIPPDFSHHGVFPSVDSIVSPDGTVDVQMVDAMVIHHDEDEVGFYGCVLGRGLFTEDQNKKLKEMSTAVGRELAKIGYRGWYDVDYILSRSGDFYATECNLRRTSICYMLDLAKLLFGENYENKMAMRSNDKYIRPNMKDLSYRDLKAILEPVLYPMAEQQRGIVITQSFRAMYDRGKFGYVSIGEDQNDTRNIELELNRLLKRV